MSKHLPAAPRRAPARPRMDAAPTYPALLPLGALLLAGSINANAQTPAPVAAPESAGTLPTVFVREKAEVPEGKDALRATETQIGKGTQKLRDIPQSVTVVTEKLIDDRNLDTLKDVLKNTGGISFLAAEGGEEDIKLRGFSLQATGDVFVDGLRDPAFYDRDTFNLDRVELPRGSASMLFGRGSTGGAVNMVNKVPRLIDENQVDLTLGSHAYKRAVGDFNIKTGDSAALRLGAMVTKADNNGAGSSIDKNGLSADYRWGIGERDEFAASVYHLDNNNGINYGLPWIKPTAGSDASATTLLPLDPDASYGMGSDYSDGSASTLTLSHIHRFDNENSLTTKVRRGAYTRDQRSGAVRLCTRGVSRQTGLPTNTDCPSSVALDTFGPNTMLSRGNHTKVQDLDTVYAQSDFSGKFEALGLRHELQAGVDAAREEKIIFAVSSVSKPRTEAGTPNDGAWIDEGARTLTTSSQYVSQGYGAYVQDLVQIAPMWKLLAGLRYDNLTGDYDSFSSNNPGSYKMNVSEWSQRAGVLFQPSARQSYHFSAATSFNTSGDAYSLSANNVDVPPEQAINLEIGAKLDSADGNFTTRLAVFRSTKLHERNTDPDVDLVTLSGKRHVAGFETDITGRITPQWEIYGSYVWMPVANIDIGVPGSEGQGTRPSLTPEHSGTVWSTYKVTPRFRLGAGLNFRGKQSPNRNPGWEADAYVTGDLMAEYTFDFDRIALKANLTNVTNKLYADQLYSGHYIPGAGRMLQVTASLKF
jgi:catecholate siderophore receptor